MVSNRLLDDMGFAGYAPEERAAIASSLGTALQERVGERLTRGMSDRVLDEFGFFMDQNVPAICAWLDKHMPGWPASIEYAEHRRRHPDERGSAALASFGCVIWLQVYCPDYERVVNEELAELVAEMQSATALLP